MVRTTAPAACLKQGDGGVKKSPTFKDLRCVSRFAGRWLYLGAVRGKTCENGERITALFLLVSGRGRGGERPAKGEWGVAKRNAQGRGCDDRSIGYSFWVAHGDRATTARRPSSQPDGADLTRAYIIVPSAENFELLPASAICGQTNFDIFLR